MRVFLLLSFQKKNLFVVCIIIGSFVAFFNVDSTDFLKSR